MKKPSKATMKDLEEIWALARKATKGKVAADRRAARAEYDRRWLAFVKKKQKPAK